MNETSVKFWKNIEVFMRYGDELLLLGALLVIFFCGCFFGNLGSNIEWKSKIESKKIIEADGRYYEVKEVLLLKSYKDK